MDLMTTNCSDPYFTDSVIYPVGGAALHLTLGITGLVSNSLVFLVFYRLPRLRMKTHNIILFNLALADFCSSAFMASRSYVHELDPPNPFWKAFVCRFFKSDFPLWTCVTASIYNLLLVTGDRYLCVVKPFLYRRFFIRPRIRFMVVVCWISSAILDTYCLYSTRVNACGFCEIHWPSKALQIICTAGTFLLNYLLPTLLMLYAYANIVRTLKARESVLQSQHQPIAAGNLLRARRNVVRMLQLLVVLFGFLWAPNQLIFLYLSFPGTSLNIDRFGYSVVLAMGFSNCVINPVVYAFKNPQFKNALLSVLSCRRAGAVGPSELNPSVQPTLKGATSRSTLPIKLHVVSSALNWKPSHHSPTNKLEVKAHCETNLPFLLGKTEAGSHILAE